MYESKLQTISLAALLSVLVLAAAPAAQAADAGMRIVRDPITGKLRGPTAEEFKAMEEQEAKAKADQAASAPAAAGPAAAPQEFQELSAPSGAVGFRVGDAFLNHSVMTRNADGTMTLHCVTGTDAAEKLTKNPQSSTAGTDREHGHAHK